MGRVGRGRVAVYTKKIEDETWLMLIIAKKGGTEYVRYHLEQAAFWPGKTFEQRCEDFEVDGWLKVV